jgi:glycosyltransferase involved in cell wall biosynthesis
MKKPRALARFLKACKKLLMPPDILGYAERVETDGIYGWALHRKGTPIQLSCRIAGKTYGGQTTWVERGDVARQHRSETVRCGFQFVPVPAAKLPYSEALANGEPIVLLANGVALKDIRLEPVLPLQAESLNLAHEGAGWRAELESWGHFTVQGQVAGTGAALPVGELRCDGRALECAIAWQLRSQSGERWQRGFEIALPGYLWETAGDGCALEVFINGESLTPAPLPLTRAKALAWIADITRMGEGTARQYRALLALEHIQFGGFLSRLAAKEARFMRDFAEKMRLDSLLLEQTAALAEVPEPSESVVVLWLWRAMRELNQRMLAQEPGQPLFPLVRAVTEEMALRGDTKELFLRSAIAALCQSGEFLHLRELMDFSRLQKLGSIDNTNEMTLAIPALVAGGHLQRATEVLQHLQKNLHSGWLNTAALHGSVQLLQQLENEGEVAFEAAEKFRYALIGVLEAFRGEWFSRLHDSQLVGCMLALLADVGRHNDYFRRDVVEAALRIYGLNPAFWEAAQVQGLLSLDGEIVRGHGYFRRLRLALSGRLEDCAAWLPALDEPIRYFLAKKNPEALIVLREVCAQLLAERQAADSSYGRALLAELMAGDAAEAVRVAAFPMPAENSVVERYGETAAQALQDTLRRMGEFNNSLTWRLQETAAAALGEAQAAELPRLQQALARLQQLAAALANRPAQFLAADLLASAYSLADAHGLNGAPLLAGLRAVMKTAMAEAEEDGYWPAPLAAGLHRLAVLENGDALRRSVLAEARAWMALHADGDIAGWQSSRNGTGAGGWPRDTWVIVYSCRKYLDSRVQSIRETWVRDLQARGIPYLVLVGDGDDSVQGDVLALDVSDRYEDLPKKTLKLFAWLYQHTDAQYVLKIDDDCHLDVAHYFDTLSYRKHHYYGRVIRREVGSMDRTWHQSKSDSPYSRKSLDKSPEPAVYADGGGAYTLSRTALGRLLASAQTQQGERLIACSFMEDKLVGDLLALSGISPSDEDYSSYQRRRTFAEAMPVGMWENSFFPSRATPAKVTHLDNHLDLPATQAKMAGNELWPKKLWPTCWAPAIKYNSNQLELLGELDKALALLRHDVVVVAAVRNEMIMLPHFLAHYRGLGVRCFIVVDNCSDDGTREYLCGQDDVIVYSSDTEYKVSHYGVAWQQAVLGNLCLGKWVVLADADELLVYPDCENRPLADFAADIEAEGCNAAATLMIDMYPPGDLAEADFTRQPPFAAAPMFDKVPLLPWRMGSGLYSNGKTYVSALRHRLAAATEVPPNSFTAQKYALLRYQPWVRYSQGLHDASNLTVSQQPAWFAHFKYHAGFKEKVQTEIRRGQHFNNAAEYRHYATMLSEGAGNFYDPEHSVRYHSSADFVRYCGNILER